MASLFLFCLSLLLGYFILFKRKKMSLIVVGILILNFIFMATGAIPSCLLSGLQTYSYDSSKISFSKRNAILLLGGGVAEVSKNIVLPSVFTYSRIVATAETYFACKRAGRICTVITSGGDLKFIGNHIYKNELVKLGVNANDIKTDSKSKTTFENAKFSAEILNKNKFNQVFLVSSGFHLKRAILSFSHFNVKVTPIPSDYLIARNPPFNIAYNLALSDIALHEYLGILKYKLFDFNSK